ncbi:hypothetical protein QYF36_013926 [Acer negundo]|nr:hypothetical protein QYF36_013926 [Acer negundo]
MKILMMTVGYSSTRWESSIFCTDVSSVLKELRDRKILASSFYLGDKNILWTFKSFKDRDTFIRNRLLWEDHFSSVGLWSNAITPQSKLSWIEFGGIQLQCWCEKFFLRRVLVLSPFGLQCSGAIKVVTGRSSFSVHTLRVLGLITLRRLQGVNEASRLKNLNLVGPRSGELAATNLLSNHKPADNASHVRKDFQYKDVLTNGNGVFNVGTVVDQNDHLYPLRRGETFTVVLGLMIESNIVIELVGGSTHNENACQPNMVSNHLAGVMIPEDQILLDNEAHLSNERAMIPNSANENCLSTSFVSHISELNISSKLQRMLFPYEKRRSSERIVT